MPAIKVYKGQGKMIPVAEAKVAKAYQCPWTKDLFATKASYVSHLKKLREIRMHKQARYNRRQRLGYQLWSQPDFHSVINWIETHPEWFFDNGAQRRGERLAPNNTSLRDDFQIRMLELDLHWSERISNSHSCPVGGVTNWGSDRVRPDGSPAPKGYPGWSGRIKIQYKTNKYLSFGSDVFSVSRIHTGTGGGGGDGIYQYDVKFFDSDWPGITASLRPALEEHERDCTLRILAGRGVPTFTRKFSYKVK